MAAPTERSQLWTTGGAGDGASTYTRDNLAEMWRAMFLSDPTTQGVLNGLAVSGTSSPLTLAVGAACVYGYLYFCTVAGDVPAISTPVVGTTGFRVVLRAGWTAQTVRVAVVVNTDGVAAIPAATQSAGTTWEITLATGTITTGGVITLTDARVFCPPVPTEKIADNAVTDAKLRQSASLSVIGRAATGTGNVANITATNDNEVLRRSGSTLGFGQVVTAGIADSAVTAAKIADRTRSFFVPAMPVGAAVLAAYGVELPDAVASNAAGQFFVPVDFASGMVATPLIQRIAAGSGNVTISNSAWLSAHGQTLLTHTVTEGEVLAVPTQGNRTRRDAIALDLADAAAGDYVTLTFTRLGADGSDTYADLVYIVGWLVSYTADS